MYYTTFPLASTPATQLLTLNPPLTLNLTLTLGSSLVWENLLLCLHTVGPRGGHWWDQGTNRATNGLMGLLLGCLLMPSKGTNRATNGLMGLLLGCLLLPSKGTNRATNGLMGLLLGCLLLPSKGS